MAIKVTRLPDGNDVWGGRSLVQHLSVDLDNSYPTGGYPLAASFFFGAKATFRNVWNVLFGDGGTTGGGAYRYYYDIPNGKLMVYRAAGATPAGTVAFTGTTPLSDLNLATPLFSGTGYATAGQVITTTDNQTMTLNQCAGMWFVPATNTKPPVLILSNTAVAGAPAVLTVQGVAPTTDAGAYKIVTGPAPVGTATFTGTAIAAGALVQVSNAVDLSAIVGLRMTVFGR